MLPYRTLSRELVIFGLAMSLSTIPIPSLAFPQAEASKTETWFGWIETPKQQLRTIVRLQRDSDGKAISGVIVSPDQIPDELPVSDLQIDSKGSWQFTVVNPVDAKRNSKYSGSKNASGQVAGDFEQVGLKMPLLLNKVDSLPMETRENLGADAVWLGTLDLVVRKMDFRIRIYSKPPYATQEAPRLFFDSLTERAVGIPAQFKVEKGVTTFEMKSMGAKFVGKINEAGDQLDGRFIQGPLPLPLVMKLQLPEKPVEPSENANKPIPASGDLKAVDAAGNLSDVSPFRSEVDTTVAPGASPSKRATASSAFFEETPFEVNYGKIKPKKDKEPTAAERGTTLAGTLTVPTLKQRIAPRKFPAVVMVTGSGPQDRDETIGRHKPFEKLAHYLAENGIASLRFDDRGVGESTGDFLNATSSDFAKDAIAVWNYAKTLPSLDATKIGILGHSEGGLVGPIAAVWEPYIAFLILLAPPGITGSEILKTQIDRISELQGMNAADRKATLALQGKLQDIASGYFTDDAAFRRDIQNAIKQNWDSIKTIASADDPNVDLDQIRKDLTSQIESQSLQLRMPWFQFFLSYDPAPNWMMVRCPTLAIWGGNDVQVLPELNRNAILRAIARNPMDDAELSILPGLNHLLQTSETGLPEDYDKIEETISPVALNTIRIWLTKQGLIER